jgi:hypothetical protein
MGGPQRQDESLAILELIRIEGAQAITSDSVGEFEVAIAIAGPEGQLQLLKSW